MFSEDYWWGADQVANADSHARPPGEEVERLRCKIIKPAYTGHVAEVVRVPGFCKGDRNSHEFRYKARCRKPSAAFTLIELLVVIGVIAILIAMLVPAVQKVRESAARTTCQNNLKQIGLAIHSFHGARGHIPHQEPGGNLYSPFTALLPYLEQEAAASLYKPNLSPTDPVNLPITSTPLKTYICPTMRLPPSGGGTAYASYVASIGSSYNWDILLPPGRVNGFFTGADKIRFKDVRDGLSNTFAVGEQGYQLQDYPTAGQIGGSTSWAFGYPASAYGSAYNKMNHKQHTTSPIRASGLGSFRSDHLGGCNFVFGDGSVRFLRDTINRDAVAEPVPPPLTGDNPYAAGPIFRALATRAGEEVVKSDE
jgi:prepilin-type N-terminal cleavage/methylation domain-containing protein/prepilin-type processing-associated H-X9-DG protein